MAERRDDRRPRRLVTSTVKMDEAYAPVEETAKPKAAPKPAAKAAAEPESAAHAGPAPAVAPDEGARPIGEGGRGWAVVEVSEDRQRATLTAIALNGLLLSAKQLARDLAAAFGLQGTFDGKVLRQLIPPAVGAPVRGSYPIVRGTPATPGEDGRVDLVCLRAAGDTVDQALAAELAPALAAATVAEALAADLTGITVGPGQAIARIVPPTPGTPGKDVLGGVVSEPGQPVRAEAGAHTRLEDDQIVAEVYGYVRRTKSTFAVVPPVWVAADRMQAHLVHFAELRRLPQVEVGWLVDALRAAGVVAGVDEEALAGLVSAWPAATEASSLRAAAGVPPVHGQDTHVDFAFDPTKRAGAVRPDGSIDFRERNAVVGVSEGQLIGKVMAATTGQAGTDVTGKELPARDGEERTITAGANVTAKVEDGTTAFYSDIDGAVNVSADAVEVQPIFSISGDVDYETGNIDLPMNVEIGGSVKSEFSVRSGGSIVVGGVLEPGCELIAGGDVIVARGMFGEKTRITAKGNVEIKLIQNGSVTLQGDLTVGTYIYNAVVRAGGTVTVAEGSGPKAGSIVGGEVLAGRQVVAKLIGSADTDRTLVGLGPTPEQQRQRQVAERAAAAATREISRLVDTLGLRGTADEQMEARRKRCRDEADLARIDAGLAELRAALQARSQAQEELESIQQAVDEALAAGTIRAKTIFPDVYVDFGGEVSRVDSKVVDAEFYLSEEGLRWRPT